MKLQQDGVNQIFDPNAFFSSFLQVLHDITMLFTYFASFTGYEDDISKVVSSLHVQESKFGGKIYKFGGKSFKKLNSAEFMEFVFSKSDSWCSNPDSWCHGKAKQNTQSEAVCLKLVSWSCLDEAPWLRLVSWNCLVKAG